MAEQTATPTPAPAETPAPAVTPAVEAAPAPAVETPIPAPVEATPEAPKPADTVLGEAFDKSAKEAEKPVEAKKEDAPPAPEEKPVEATEEKKTEEGGQSEEPAPPPTYDAFTVPEHVTLDAERVKAFTDILGELESKTKVDHALVQEFGQKAVNLYINEVQTAVENLTKFYQQTWEKQRTDWKDAFLKDPEIGGNRFQTTVDAANNFIRTHGGTAEQQTEFRNLMESSGLGNHPAMIRILANASRAMAEGQPLAAPKPVTEPKSRTATLYGKSG